MVTPDLYQLASLDREFAKIKVADEVEPLQHNN